MSEFLLEKAMGYHRHQRMDEVRGLQEAGQDDSGYDAYFANRPVEDDIPPVQDSVSPVQDGDDDYRTAKDHQSDGGGPGLIEEEQSQASVIERRPSVAYSTESSMVEPWLPRSRDPRRAGQASSNRVMGKYWRTFGERSSAIGGGLGGFFGALFGRGMKRANALAGARARRAAERGAEPVGLRSALRTRLANAGEASAAGLEQYPREPGVAYDDAKVQRTLGAYAKARAKFDAGAERKYGTSQEMKNAHAKYDLATGSRTQPLDADLDKHTPDKFDAITSANRRWGDAAAAEDLHPHEPKPRLRNDAGAEKRVRFMDGANAEAAPVPGDANEFDPPPRPTGVRFHPVPLMPASREGRTKRQRRALDASERAAALTDDEAVAQERALWPIRNRLSRMDPDRLEVTGMNAGMQAHILQQANPAPDAPEAAQIRELQATGELAGDISSKRLEDNNARAARSQAAFPTKSLNKFQQMTVMHELMRSGDARWKNLNPKEYLQEQLPQLPLRYFKNQFWGAYDSRVLKEQRARDAQEAVGASGTGQEAGKAAAGGSGGVGLIEEEEPQQ